MAALCGTVSPASEALRRFDLVRPVVLVASNDAADLDDLPVIRLAPDGSTSTHDPGSITARTARKVQPRPEDAACIFFTSGTTGRGQGVCREPRCARICAAAHRGGLLSVRQVPAEGGADRQATWPVIQPLRAIS